METLADTQFVGGCLLWVQMGCVGGKRKCLEDAGSRHNESKSEDDEERMRTEGKGWIP